MDRDRSDPSHLTVLVPARNAADTLPGWLDHVGRHADSIIALDDGSTDGTRALLDTHPDVDAVLTNPVRSSYHGWDDRANRQRLIHAALSLGTAWLLFLDADESIDDGDWSALREFVAHEAQPGFAYGFQVFRMIEGVDEYDPHSLWVFRLFSAVDAERPLPSPRLHLVPVPSGIPRRNWLYTSLRIRHLASMTEAHRAARFQKYREADPDNEFQTDYTNLLREPELVQPWPERSPGLPVLLGVEGRYADRHLELHDPNRPVLSVVVIAQDDVDRIGASLDALAAQDLDEPFEIIVICSGGDGTYEVARGHRCGARAVQLPDRALPGEARNAGLWMARGEYLSFPGSHIRLLPGSLAERLRTHEDGWDMVAGSVTNGNPTAAGWASYLLDHATKTPGRPEGEFSGVPGSASYVTREVIGLGGFPPDVRAGEDTAVNRALHRAGRRAYFNPQISFVHTSPCTTGSELVRHHVKRGRALGRMIRRRHDRPDIETFRHSLDLPARRLTTIRRALPTAGNEVRAQYRGRVKALVAIGAVAAASGAWFELLRLHPRRDGEVVIPAEPADPTGPRLVLSGRPGEAPSGLLAGGDPQHAVQRLTTLARYARSVTEVRPVLAPIVTSATVTAEQTGTFTLDLRRSTAEAFAAAARGAGVGFALQLQPGAADLLHLLDRWSDLVADPAVGVYLDLRPEVAWGGQQTQLAAVVDVLAARLPDPLVIVRGVVRGVDEVPDGVLTFRSPLDLRVPGTPFPHELFATGARPEVLVYE